MPTYRVTIEYDGTRYSGWQEQRNAETVQGVLLRTARELSPGADIGGAGRTDAGVHALGQVAHLITREPRDPRLFLDRWNRRLPRDINVLQMSVAPPRFHARHDAIERYYLYQIALRRSAFNKKFIWWVRDRMDAERIQRRAAELTGMHDFSYFADKRRDEEGSAKVLLTECTVSREGDLLLIRLGASHFLWKMVRRLVGTLVAVGAGKLPDEPLLALGRKHASELPALTAPSSGLFLEYVRYEGDPTPPPVHAITPLPGMAIPG